MMHLQKNITFSYNAAITFFPAKQGTLVHKDDRGPFLTCIEKGKYLLIKTR